MHLRRVDMIFPKYANILCAFCFESSDKTQTPVNLRFTAHLASDLWFLSLSPACRAVYLHVFMFACLQMQMRFFKAFTCRSLCVCVYTRLCETMCLSVYVPNSVTKFLRRWKKILDKAVMETIHFLTHAYITGTLQMR